MHAPTFPLTSALTERSESETASESRLGHPSTNAGWAVSSLFWSGVGWPLIIVAYLAFCPEFYHVSSQYFDCISFRDESLLPYPRITTVTARAGHEYCKEWINRRRLMRERFRNYSWIYSMISFCDGWGVHKTLLVIPNYQVSLQLFVYFSVRRVDSPCPSEAYTLTACS